MFETTLWDNYTHLRFAFRDAPWTGLFFSLSVHKNVIQTKEDFVMRESIVRSYEELPLFLSAQNVADVLGVSISSAYELMHEDGFPSLRIGNRLVIPKDHFRKWVEEHVGK